MPNEQGQAIPVRGPAHQALSAFLGTWDATGMSFGGTDQSGEDPRARGVPWASTHETHWYTGGFFLGTDERAFVGGSVFDTLAMMGVDAETGEIYVQSFENHGFARRYAVSCEGRVWTLTGERERARIEFSEDGHTQTVAWKWKPEERWLPLCDRVARRTE